MAGGAGRRNGHSWPDCPSSSAPAWRVLGPAVSGLAARAGETGRPREVSRSKRTQDPYSRDLTGPLAAERSASHPECTLVPGRGPEGRTGHGRPLSEVQIEGETSAEVTCPARTRRVDRFAEETSLSNDYQHTTAGRGFRLGRHKHAGPQRLTKRRVIPVKKDGQ